MDHRLKNACYLAAGLLLWVLPLSAQLQVGDDIKLSLSGDLNAGYAGSFGNQGASEHSFAVSGDTNLTGSYFNPNFLSFNVHPYYNRSQANSTFQSIGDASGFDANVNIFGGSHFPGFVSFGKSYDSTGQFAVPGSSAIITHGDTQQFGIGWSAFVPGLPTLSASFSTLSASSSVYGTEQTNDSSNRTFNVRSDYLWRGFRLQGSYVRLSTDASLPDFLDGLGQESSGTSNSLQFSASHSFPLRGSFSVGVSRTSFSYESGSTNNLTATTNQNATTSGTGDTLSAGVYIHPLDRLSATFSSTYTDNLSDSIAQQIINSGGPAPQLNLGESRALFLGGSATLTVIPNLLVYGGVNHQEQFFLGQSYGSTQLNVGAAYNYSRPLFGVLSFSVGMTDTATKEGNTGAGLNANVGFYRKVHRFEVGANFSYAQFVQTVLAISTTSSYSYSASVSRKVSDRTFWNGSFGAGRSGFGQQGSSSHSERVSTGLSFRGYSANLFYSQAAGTSLLTANGLVATPPDLPPGVLPPGAIVLYNARSYGAGLSATIFKRMSLTGAYSQGDGTTISPALNSGSSNQMYTSLLRYPVRKMYVFAGFTHFKQGISTAGIPSVINSYNFGIARWFNVF